MKLSGKTDTLDISDCDLAGSRFDDVNLSGSSFSNARLQDGRFADVNLTGTVIANADLHRVDVRDCNLDGMLIDGLLVTDLLAAYRRQRT